MLIPVGRDNQEFVCVDKLEDGTIRKHTIVHVRYVPLTEPEAQLGRQR